MYEVWFRHIKILNKIIRWTVVQSKKGAGAGGVVVIWKTVATGQRTRTDRKYSKKMVFKCLRVPIPLKSNDRSIIKENERKWSGRVRLTVMQYSSYCSGVPLTVARQQYIVTHTQTIWAACVAIKTYIRLAIILFSIHAIIIVIIVTTTQYK